MGVPLDANGVSVIDYQNSGNPGAFVALARALGFPWFMLCDNDAGGAGHIEQVRTRGVSEAEIAQRVVILPHGDLEAFLAQSIPGELGEIAVKLGAQLPASSHPAYSAELAKYLRDRKTEYAATLARDVAQWKADKVPEPFSTTLKRCIEAASV
jgi:putative ATP-dependent endonuclease of OLD family